MATTTEKKKHQKHTKLQKPQLGNFGRHELSFIGTTCAEMKKLADRITHHLASSYKLAYVDAEHSSDDSAPSPVKHTLLYTQRGDSQRFEFSTQLNSYHIKSQFNEIDLVLVNGNHFSAGQQVVVIDPRKSLQKKGEQLTDVKMIILQEDVHTVSPEIKDLFENFDSIPIYNISEPEQIAGEVKSLIQQAIPSISGLVLAGGKSTRMHTDKTVLDYHGKPQRTHLYELLGDFCDDVFISCRKDQEEQIPDTYKTIPDVFLEMGPMGAILSAFRRSPNTAWLSVACDLPLLSPESLQYLVENRNPSKIATAFNNPDSSFPEPLITIWESRSYPVLLHFLSLGYSCPRKALINSDIELLEAPDPRELTNVNRPDEYREALEAIKADA
ncbi:NTP transferase domain-containing protein [Aliifodinibius sp. S!AR15-10]|uniref:NTP transferase domain-containing protein n=1 Tax=Aliifodinibius sp. S!AR15-10 TaxID=2950437 RepID=UPI00286334EE|nr:NTP transferase domain-containing protein [Aliifodinibius sp. S!AR15-10]MDR8394138.1 NTP transferase domain-containing protein [Aliifodinibius sp. S!AR15-10]